MTCVLWVLKAPRPFTMRVLLCVRQTIILSFSSRLKAHNKYATLRACVVFGAKVLRSNLHPAECIESPTVRCAFDTMRPKVRGTIQIIVNVRCSFSAKYDRRLLKRAKVFEKL